MTEKRWEKMRKFQKKKKKKVQNNSRSYDILSAIHCVFITTINIYAIVT